MVTPCDKMRSHCICECDTLLVTCGVTNKFVRTKCLKQEFIRVDEWEIQNTVVKRLMMFHCFKLEWVTILFSKLGHRPWTFSSEVIKPHALRLWHCRHHIFVFDWHTAQSICNAVFASFLTHKGGPHFHGSGCQRIMHCMVNWESL